MLTLIPTPIGNLSDITIRSLEIISKSELILCEDTRVTKQLLKLLEERFDFIAPMVDIISFHEHNQKQRLNEIGELLKQKFVIYMSDAGMPSISDPGVELVKYCQEHNIEYSALPGASAAPLVYALSGFDSGKFYFYGFLPKSGKERKEELEKILNSGLDTIIYEAPHRLLKLITQITEIDKDRLIFASKELTKKYQKFYKLKANELLEELNSSNIKGEWAIVVEGKEKNSLQLNLNNILSLDIPPKAKAKIIAKITGKSVKECYEEIINRG